MAEPSGSGGDSGDRRDAADAFQARMEAFGRDAQAAGERLGREAEAAGRRLANDPNVMATGTWFTRFWGLVLIAIGLWFLGEFTLGLNMPAVDWNLAWPAALVVLGGLVILSAMLRRR